MREIQVILHNTDSNVVTSFPVTRMQSALDLFKEYVEAGKRVSMSTFG